jgi:hypothetical protein
VSNSSLRSRARLLSPPHHGGARLPTLAARLRAVPDAHDGRRGIVDGRRRTDKPTRRHWQDKSRDRLRRREDIANVTARLASAAGRRPSTFRSLAPAPRDSASAIPRIRTQVVDNCVELGTRRFDQRTSREGLLPRAHRTVCEAGPAGVEVDRIAAAESIRTSRVLARGHET